MSIELVLIPIAMAVAGAVNAETGKNGFYCLPTTMKNQNLLQKALNNLGCNTIDIEGEVNMAVEGHRIIFQPNEQGVFQIHFSKDIVLDRAQELISNIQEEYARLVQQDTYDKLIARARERGLLLQSEQVEEDNSMVLIFNIQEGIR